MKQQAEREAALADAVRALKAQLEAAKHSSAARQVESVGAAWAGGTVRAIGKAQVEADRPPVAPRSSSAKGIPSATVKNPTKGGSAKVAGNRMAIATAAPTPGMAPMITPPIDPINRPISTCQSISSDSAEVKTYIGLILQK